MQYIQSRRFAQLGENRLSKGITLLEVLVVVLIIGILAAIAIPSWLKYVANRRVGAAQDEIRQGILMAQNSAIAHRSPWRFSIREVDDHIEWAAHPDTVDWKNVQTWNSLPPTVVLYATDTTLLKKEGTYYTRFGINGEVTVRLGTVTLDSSNGVARNRCVVVSTLLGATRKGKEHAIPNGKRYCY